MQAIIGADNRIKKLYVLNGKIELIAKAISIDPIPGLTATNVQEALEELATSTPGTTPEYNRSILLMGG